MPITRLRGDMAIVKVEDFASKPNTRIIIQPDDLNQNKNRTHVYWGTLQMAGDGVIGYKDHNKAPGILDCPGFEIGCRVLCLQRFHHQGAAPHLGESEVMIHDFDIMAAVDDDGKLHPAWGYCLIESPRRDREPRPAYEGSSILIIDPDKSYADRPVATGTVKATSLYLNMKNEAKNITGRVAEFWGTSEPPFTAGDHVIFRRFAGWRIFLDGKKSDDTILVPQQDVLSKIDPDADFECLDVPGQGGLRA